MRTSEYAYNLASLARKQEEVPGNSPSQLPKFRCDVLPTKIVVTPHGAFAGLQFLIAILPVKTGTSKWCPSVWLTSSNGWALCQEHDLGVLGAVVGVPKITLHTGHPPVQTEYAQFLGKVQAKVLRTG
eukprot:scaffold72913_cov17-Tisochrysis_lutea.AAC.1